MNWRVSPGASLELLHVSFTAKRPGTYKGYIHVRTNQISMVIPVSLVVTRGGIHPSPVEVDFGVLTIPEEKRKASVSLQNRGREALGILRVALSRQDPCLSVGFREGTMVRPGQTLQDAIQLLYMCAHPVTAEAVSGKVLIFVNDTNPERSMVEVGYQ
ncbi:unnamed protein product, partial [Discosporangium mesarthrocarpum]